MDEQKINIEKLLQRYLSGQANEKEKAIVESWHLQDLHASDYLPDSTQMETAHQNIRKKVLQAVESHSNTQVYLIKKIAAVALLLLMLSIGFYYFTKSDHKQLTEIPPNTFLNDAVSGNLAYLTTSDGVRISLTNTADSTIYVDQHADIKRDKDGRFAYYSKVEGQTPGYNILTVPPGGGKHELKLSDGTLVILDAGSSIRFPVSFQRGERRVRITGQVYFDVAHDVHRSFLVEAGETVIQDIGTQFNISNINGMVTTTLVGGSIKVGDILLNDPGQQVIKKEDGKVDLIPKVDLQKVMGWKNDQFVFEGNSTLKVIMDEIARWYGMDVQYVGHNKNLHFGGEMPRYSKLSDVLKILSYNGVKFSIKDKLIIVY